MSDLELVFPVMAPFVITQSYAEHVARKIAENLKWYNPGEDIVPQDAKVCLVVDGGKVKEAAYKKCPDGSPGYGNVVYVDHGDGLVSVYAHLAEMWVVPGEEVVAGQVIGVVGSTGNSTGLHLHFELRVNGVCVDPMGWFEVAEDGALGTHPTDSPASPPLSVSPLKEGDVLEPVWYGRVVGDGLRVRDRMDVFATIITYLQDGMVVGVFGEQVDPMGNLWAEVAPGLFAAVNYGGKQYIAALESDEDGALRTHPTGEDGDDQ